MTTGSWRASHRFESASTRLLRWDEEGDLIDETSSTTSTGIGSNACNATIRRPKPHIDFSAAGDDFPKWAESLCI